MTHFTGISALRRKFSLPVVLSVGLHGLAVAALGTFALTPSAKPLPNTTMTVSLVRPAPIQVVRPAPEPLRPAVQQTPARKAHPVAVKRTVPRSVAPVPVRRKPFAAPSARSRAVVAPHEPVVAVSEAQAAFKDLPRVLAPPMSPAAAFAGTEVFALPESMELLEALSAGTEAAAFSRPLPVALAGGARLLRDTAAEAGSVRSKVRPGNNPRPDYPRAAREAGWEGTVTLHVVVLPDGTAGAVTLHKTSGYAVLDDAALSAVKGWRFIPAMDGNFPIQSAVRLPVRFDLKSVN